MRIKSANDRLPISTRAASIFIPIRIRPDAVMAALSGPAGLTDATSKAGAAAGVWPRATPAATSSAALIVRRKVLGMFNLNPPASRQRGGSGRARREPGVAGSRQDPRPDRLPAAGHGQTVERGFGPARHGRA